MSRDREAGCCSTFQRGHPNLGGCFGRRSPRRSRHSLLPPPPPPRGGVRSRRRPAWPNFCLDFDGKIAFDAPQGFRVQIDLIQTGGGCIERIYATEPFCERSVASKSDLLRLRAVTVVDRGSDGEADDFRWLLSGVAGEGQAL